MMKQNNLGSILMTFILISLLISCDANTDKKLPDVITTESKEPSQTKNNQVLIIQHKVSNFVTWIKNYEAHDSIRQVHGLHNYILGRATKDTNIVIVILKMDDVAKAKELMNSPELKSRMQNAGVIGVPSFNYLEVIFNDTTALQVTERLMITHQVKDWIAWKKSFDDHKAARMSAGLLDRGLAYSVDDAHFVGIVLAVTDFKKANEFQNSPALKARMQEAGVEGVPTFLYYNVVKKY
jgi:hypothetical protein